MILLVGASASGKTEVAKYLASHYGFIKVITTTTRNMRNGEVNGRDYFFVSKEQFLKMEKEGKFVETTFFNNQYYGSGKDQIGDNKCLVVDLKGLEKYNELNDKNIVSFFLNSSDEKRKERMIARGDNIDAIHSRLLFDQEAFKKENIPHVDYFIESETSSIEEVSQKIYSLYLQERGK